MIARVQCDWQMGLPVAVRVDAQTTLLAPVETLAPKRLAALASRGALTLGLTARRAETLDIPVHETDLARVSVPDHADHAWLRAVANPADDPATPVKGPFVTLRHGQSVPWRLGIALAKGAGLLPAVVGVPTQHAIAGVTVLDGHAATLELGRENAPECVIDAHIPLKAHREGRIHVFRSGNGTRRHCAIELGHPDRTGAVLVRLHSACLTGDVMGSLKCDCGSQLNGALRLMGTHGAGMLLYLNQEGRGIGLANKIRAYRLQDHGFDTVEANHRLGFEDDERDFRIGAAILKHMGIDTVRLITNNPAKIDMMQAAGVRVAERVALWVGRTPENANYLATKAAKLGHLE